MAAAGGVSAVAVPTSSVKVTRDDVTAAVDVVLWGSTAAFEEVHSRANVALCAHA
jgi:hypothetical protein